MDESTREGVRAVEALDLGSEPLFGPLELREDTSAAVDSGSLISFTSGVSAEHKMDVLHSVLLSQLAATRQHDRHRDAENWYTLYGTTLEQVGWGVNDQTGFSRFLPPASRFTAPSTVVELLERICSEQETMVVETALNALKQLDDRDRAALLFECESHAGGIGNFQVAAVSESDNNVIMKLGRFRFNTSAGVTRLLLVEFPSDDTEFLRGSQILQLNEAVYSRVRNAIAQKLGDRAETYIIQLPDLG